MVECTALEMRHTGNRIGGSNPSLSASQSYIPSFHETFARERQADFVAIRSLNKRKRVAVIREVPVPVDLFDALAETHELKECDRYL